MQHLANPRIGTEHPHLTVAASRSYKRGGGPTAIARRATCACGKAIQKVEATAARGEHWRHV